MENTVIAASPLDITVMPKPMPCPFCGSARVGTHAKRSGRKSGYQCRCLECGVGQNGSFHPSIEAAIVVWNKRMPLGHNAK